MKYSAIQRPESDSSTINWSDDLPVYKVDPDTNGSTQKNVSRFSDDIWELHALQWKPSSVTTTIPFQSFPDPCKDAAKRIAWCMLNIDAPISLIQRPNAARKRLSKGSVATHIFAEIKPFLLWLRENDIHELSHVTEYDLRQYANEIAASDISRLYKGRRLWGPTRFWMYSAFLPPSDQLIQPPWEIEGTAEILGPAKWSAEILTIPIHPDTMSPLLVWAITLVEDCADSILTTVKVRDQLSANINTHSRVGDKERLAAFLDPFFAKWNGLPGRRDKTNGNIRTAIEYISAVSGASINCVRSSIPGRIRGGKQLIDAAPLVQAPDLVIHGQPLKPYIDYHEVDQLEALLSTACKIVIAYLSGMRSEECRSLQRGCCKRISNDEGIERYEIWSTSYKDALDAEGNSIPEGKMRAEPWHVIKPVAKAINVMELMHDDKYLFSASALQAQDRKKSESVLAPTGIHDRIDSMISWCNSASKALGQPEMEIPEDPSERITMRRFRRTLAWFIYRQPAGRISLSIQYGHLQGYTSHGYGSQVSNGLRDLFPMEEAFARADALADAAERLTDGECVSGPATDRYLKGVEEFTRRFEGKYLSVRQAAELKRDPIFKIYDNGMQPLACCYDQSKALCHPDRETSQKIETTPNLSRCDERCPNAARTDIHIGNLQDKIKKLRLQARSKVVPEPMRLRFKQKADSLAKTIKKHKKNHHRAKATSNV